VINILILYHSTSGHTEKMAHCIARGVESIENAQAILRTVPNVSANTEISEDSIPTEGAPYASLDDLAHCDGLALGSPAHFGNMSAPMKHFWDGTSPLWLTRSLINKIAGAFTTAGTMHGGQETTLTSMMTPLLHHGMLIMGLPYSEPDLNQTTTGGTPYGPSHYAGVKSNHPITAEEKNLCIACGKRLASLSALMR